MAHGSKKSTPRKGSFWPQLTESRADKKIKCSCDALAPHTRKKFGVTSAIVRIMPHEKRRWVRVRRVDECQTLDELFLNCLPAFGGAYLRRIYQILDTAIGMGCPLTLAIAGPVTVSG